MSPPPWPSSPPGPSVRSTSRCDSSAGPDIKLRLKIGRLKEYAPVLSGTRERRAAPGRGDIHLVDQVAEEGGFGQNLDVEELGDRLERDRGELFVSVQATRGVDVEDRHAEDQFLKKVD